METEVTIKSIKRSGILPEYANAGTHAGSWKFVLGTNKVAICPRVKKVLELSKSQAVSLREIFGLMHAGQKMRLIRTFKQACETGANFDARVKLHTAKGREKWVHITGVLYYRRWGKAEQMVGVIEDITQRVNEEYLSLAVVNHEMRSPLTIMKLNVQLLINMFSGNMEKSPVRILNNVDLHINCMTSLIEQYLGSSVHDDKPLVYNKSVFDLDELIDIMINEMKTLHPGYRFCKDACLQVWVNADKFKLVQVFINYLTNAVNFSPRSSQIIISAVKIGDHVEVAIRDEGLGIPEGQEQLIFQKFHRCDPKAPRTQNSKGLGLYLVKEIIQGHGGRVKAERAGNCGSVFYFSLPVYECVQLPKAVGLAY